jgi:uncharacterized membrane protein HdeD (DUF308 family)
MPTVTDTFHTDTAATPFGHRWGWLLALGIVQIIAGCIAIAVPVIASLAAVGMFGAVLLVTGIMQLIHAFKVRAWQRSAWYGLGAVLYVIAGLLVVAYPLGGALTLAIMIAILFIADGTLRTVFGMTVRPAPGWGWLVAAGFASVIVGVILLIGWPGTALWATGLLLGVNLIFGGIMNTTLAIASRRGA